jgi:hypothetical protein
MSIPWWVYLIGVLMVGFGVAIHLAPVFLAKLEEQDRLRREAMATKTKRDEDGGGE